MNKTRRYLLLGSVSAAAIGMFGYSVARQKENAKTIPAANAQLGINLAGIADWGTEFPFVDMFKQSRAWFVVGKESANSGLVLD